MLSSAAVTPRTRILVSLAKWAALTARGLFALWTVLGIGGYASPFPVSVEPLASSGRIHQAMLDVMRG
jgi:hypothetical protein